MRETTATMLRKHRKLIAHTANDMAAQLGYSDPDELVSFARSALIKRARYYDPDRGAVTTFIVWVTRNAIRDFVKRQRRLVTSDQVDEFVPDDRMGDSLPNRLNDVWFNCSEAAREVIAVCLTLDLDWVFRDPWRARRKVRSALNARGMDVMVRRNAIRELYHMIKAW